MRSPADMDTIQVEITNACVMTCANCTRFCGHQTPYFTTMENFKQAIDSLVDFPNIVGFMGGEPLLHPQFDDFCEYALTKIPRNRLGLWSTFPPGEKFSKHREAICKTFGNVLLNDHSRPDIMHGPILVAIEEVVKDKAELYRMVDKCWVQNSWSASVNPNGAFFCEVAGAMSVLFDGPKGWPVEKDWWKKTPKDFTAQIEEYCAKCGCGLPLIRRSSQDNRDDISPGNLERLKGKSRKVANGDKGPGEIGVVVSNFVMDNTLDKTTNYYPNQPYKDFQFRSTIADRYGIFLTVNERGYLEPNLKTDWVKDVTPPKSLFNILQDQL